MVSPISLSLMRPGGTNLGWLVRGPDGALPYMQAQYDLDRGWFNGKAYGTLSAFNAAASGTFSRASDGSYFGADGLLKTAGPNVLRLTHDPATGKALGYLAEPARTNLETWSEDLTKGLIINGSVLSNDALAPDGQMTMDKLVEDTATDNHGALFSLIGFTSGTTYTYARFFKAAERDRITLWFPAGAFAPVASVNAAFDLTAGTVIFTTGPVTAGIDHVGGGIWRCWISATATATTASARFFMRMLDGSGQGNYTGDGVSGVYTWGGQFEAGGDMTSYIPTTTAAVTRLADSLSYAMAGTPEGTVVIEGRAAPGLGSQVLWQWDDDTEANRYRIIRGLTGNARLIVTAGGTDNVNLDMGALANNTDYRIAASFKSGSYSASLNGAAAATSSYAGSLPSVSKMRVGQSKTGDQASATIARTIDFTKAYTAAQVAGMSAL